MYCTFNIEMFISKRSNISLNIQGIVPVHIICPKECLQYKLFKPYTSIWERTYTYSLDTRGSITKQKRLLC